MKSAHGQYLWLWSLLLGLGLPSIAAGDDLPAPQLRAGASVVDVTPAQGVALDGIIAQAGPVVAVHDPLYVRALVLEDGSTRLAIVVCDSTMISRDLIDRAKRTASLKTGIEPHRMLVAATHTHAAPRAIGICDGPLDRAYTEILERGITTAIERASRRVVPARVGWACGDLTSLPRLRRRYLPPGALAETPFGPRSEKVGSVFAPNLGELPAGPVDPQLSVLSVQYADGRPLAVLGSFGIHYAGGYETGHVSADYFGVVAQHLESALGDKGDPESFVGIMANGTSGNVSALAQPGEEPWKRIQSVGRTIANEILRLYPTIEHRHAGLAAAQAELELETRTPGNDLMAWAAQRWPEVEAKTLRGGPLTLPEIYSREAIMLSRLPRTEKVVLQAIRIGDLAIAAIPCEVFTETGLAIKRNSPHRHTFTLGLSNGASGYLPPPDQHQLGGYETWPARSSRLDVEAEPRIRDAVLDLLNSL